MQSRALLRRIAPRRAGLAVSAVTFFALAAATPALATTIGDTTLPTSSTMGPACSASGTAEIIQAGTGSPYAYAVPAGGGTITSWSFNATNAKAGTPYGLLVVRPSGTKYTILGSDSETVPNPVPAVATFNLAHPITVQGGDLIGVVVSGTQNTVDCRFKGGSLNSNDIVGASVGSTANGSTFTLINSTANELVNVAATVVQSNDVGVSQKAEPASIVQGDDGVFVANVTSSGPSATPVTVTDTLPTGLSLVSASAGSGTCSQSGQTVTCTVSGAPASVAIVVSPTVPGTYTNTVTAKGTIFDPNTANNTASQTLTVKPVAVTAATAAFPHTTQAVGLTIQAGPITI